MAQPQAGQPMADLSGRSSNASPARSRPRTRAHRSLAAALSQPKCRTRINPRGNTCCRNRRINSSPLSRVMRSLPLARSVPQKLTLSSSTAVIREASNAVFCTSASHTQTPAARPSPLTFPNLPHNFLQIQFGLDILRPSVLNDCPSITLNPNATKFMLPGKMNIPLPLAA